MAPNFRYLLTGFILSCTMKKYHPSRVLTLVYQPFALATMAILAYNEARIDTRKRNLAGFTLFFLTTFALLVVCSNDFPSHFFSFLIFVYPGLTLLFTSCKLDLATSGKGGLGNYIGICAIIAAFGVADAFVEGGMVGDLSFMCPEFIQVRFKILFFFYVVSCYYNSWITFAKCFIAIVMNLQSYLAGLAASGALTSALRLVTKAAFEKASNGLRKGVSTWSEILSLDSKWKKGNTCNVVSIWKIGPFPLSESCGCWFCSVIPGYLHILWISMHSSVCIHLS